ncbi:efflux RND transporter periplasmic adaptor subunit [Sporomusa acidovorans]|uniref:efflux RND transporter periplasmic adaptor subunit n=1 Tax=Sporomusa acidovorans TaxID=112900 RepID=UPI000885E344|nr:efflux RND transporter periplasmic adaptor subunit [Sporomusa acidovorans]OZC18965.1 cation efflux system protein CusB precursor [Sporomusa acidovorans DSM 3132]SDD71219.1 membrane fusion protein, Cu(I)/Ag(I) efflux system [Sporomusa acidovorans]
MIDKIQAKKKLIIGVTAGVLVVGGAGYYYTQHNKPAVDHSGHNTNTPVMAMGDTVTLDAKARQLAGVQTAQAVIKPLSKEIKTTGKIAMNESGRTYITSRVEGRVDELYITADGEYIAPGQAIASVYSPTYIAAQEEYLLAIENVQKLRNASKDIVQINNRLRDAARRKLQLLNVADGDIAHLEHTQQPNDHMTIYAQFGGTVLEKQVLPGAFIMPGDKLYSLSDLSTVWLYADIYEKDIAGITPGQPVVVTSGAYPGETFTGNVVFINPVMDDATRTVKVRVEMANPTGKLKPNMFVNANVQIPLGDSLVIPESSLLDTGSRKIVFVAQSEDTFVKREVVTGQQADGYVQILSGLQSGETVVTAATFLIDSQTKLGSFGSHAGHGGGGAAKGSATPAPAPSGSNSGITAPVQTPSAPAAGGEHSGHSGH